MSEFGGFEHNRQTLRIVNLLEHPYPDFAGLNLMYETRLGLAKHRSPYDNSRECNFAELNCSLEGQVADIADRIAYNCHDLEDGLRAGLIQLGQLQNIELFAEAQRTINAANIKDPAIRQTRTAKTIIDKLVSDCIDTSKKMIADAGIKTVEQLYCRSQNLIVLSAENNTGLVKLEQFLMDNFYLNESVTKIADKIRDWLEKLFSRFCQKSQLMPDYFQKLAAKEGLQRTVCDYIAGMTDRFCLKMLEKTETEPLDNL